MSGKRARNELALEVTVLSAQSLKNPFYSLLPVHRPLRPYVVLSAAAAVDHLVSDHGRSTIYCTRVDEDGGQNPTWGDTISLPLSPSFFLRAKAAARTGYGDHEDDDSSGGVRVSVLSRRFLGGPAEIGWCTISASDLLDGLRPPAMRRRLSYTLRSARHGGRGHGVIHVAARLVGPYIEPPAPDPVMAAPAGWSGVAIGIPVAAPPAMTVMRVEASRLDTWQALRRVEI